MYVMYVCRVYVCLYVRVYVCLYVCMYVCMYVYIVVVIEFWHGFVEYNYMSLNCQLIPLQLLTVLTSNDYNYPKMTNHIVGSKYS